VDAKYAHEPLRPLALERPLLFAHPTVGSVA
jgi:hypothetical protein